MASFTISNVDADQQASAAERIEDELLRSLAKVNTQSANESVVLTANNENGDMIGGVMGSTSYGWLLVKTLWVNEDFKGSGIGRKLMLAVEDEGRRLGCHNAWLDTSNARARTFYLRLGYVDFGSLDNAPIYEPRDHCRWFMKKVL